VFEPIRWNARFGWRPLCEQERLAYFYFWREVGRRMNIRTIPATYEEFERFNVAYEHTGFRYNATNKCVAEATRELFLSWFPRPLRGLARPAIDALLDDPLIEAFGFPRPSRRTRALVTGALRLRAALLRLLPARRRPFLRTEQRQRSYPAGYRIEDVGPPQREATSGMPELRR
jgi:hypothetical protein